MNNIILKFKYDLLKQLLDERGIKVANLVNVLGINGSVATRWKKGVLPSLTHLYKISKYFSLKIDDFLEEY
jgi:transcriptional regulator with XRE-family HTH domain